jgi:hypothetical protein
MIKQLARYLSVLETKVVGSESGWENSLKDIRGKRGNKHRLKFCSLGSMLFWMLIVAAPTGIITYRLLVSLYSGKAVPVFLMHFAQVVLTWAGGDVKVIAIVGAVATALIAAGAVWAFIHRTGLDGGLDTIMTQSTKPTRGQ